MDRELNIDIDTNAGWDEELVLDLSPISETETNPQMQGNNNFTSSGSNVGGTPPSIIQPKQHDHGFPHMVTASSFNNNFQSEFPTANLPNHHHFSFLEGTPSIPLMQYGYGAPKLGTCLSFNNYSSQSEKSGVPAKTPTSNTNYYCQNAETIKRSRKREADKRHNEKKKGQIQKTAQELSLLGIENKFLKDENGCLKNENEAMKVSLGLSNAETKLLTTEVRKLNNTIKLQAVTVATLSDKVVRLYDISTIKQLFFISLI
ncbi:hypothetical protein ACFE04_006276 [Oxalis oulophora]